MLTSSLDLAAAIPGYATVAVLIPVGVSFSRDLSRIERWASPINANA